MCHCLLVVNHAIDEWRRRLSACLNAEMLKADILIITYDCYSQNNNNGSTVNLIIGDDFFCSLLL